MFKKLMKNKKAQNTAEYAILISLVVAGIIAMQTYAQRALQARVRDAGTYLKDKAEFDNVDSTTQYEPYYLSTNYVVNRVEQEIQLLDNETTEQRVNSTKTRAAGGEQISTYNASLTGIVNDV